MSEHILSESLEYERYVDGLRAQNSQLVQALSILVASVKQDLGLFPGQPHKESALGIAIAALAASSRGDEPTKTITIHIEGGMVQDVTGIPAGCEVRVEDYDHQDDTQPTWDSEKGCHVTVYEGVSNG